MFIAPLVSEICTLAYVLYPDSHATILAYAEFLMLKVSKYTSIVFDYSYST